MKKKLFVTLFFLFPLWGIEGFFPLWGLGGFWGFSAFAQTSSKVLVKPITADYAAATPTVTFKVSWPAGTRDADHHSKVWLLIDYKRIKDNAYADGWLRAGIAALPAYCSAGTPALEPGNPNGFWLQGTDGAFAATVTVPVTVEVGKDGYDYHFGWCGWAFDRPPVAELQANGSYKLYGTSPFRVNGEWLAPGVDTYGPKICITSFTDATVNPAAVLPAPTSLALTSATVCYGQPATLTASAEGALMYTIGDDAWEWQDGLWHETTDFVVTPATTTAYTLIVRNAAGCRDTLTGAATVTVNGLPAVTAPIAPFERCGVGAIDLRVAITVNGVEVPENDVTVRWYDNDQGAGDPVHTGATWSPTLSALTTSYYVGATVNASGCASASLTRVIANVILDEGRIGGMEQ